MGRRKTNLEVEAILDSKDLCDWDGIYLGANTPLNCKCKICNNDCHPALASLKKYGGCQKCGAKRGGEKQKIDIEEVLATLEKGNLYDWDGVYINTATPLNCKCKICNSDCHPELGNLRNGQGGCIICATQIGTEKRKIAREEVVALLEANNLYNWDGVYIEAHVPLNCKCKICDSDCHPSYLSLHNGQGGCNVCGKIKGAKSSKHCTILYHWQTGDEVICVGGYEAAVADGYLNADHMIYLWQPKTFNTPFLTPTGKISTYRPDACLFDPVTGAWTWIEIKGFMREHSRKKWEWFHAAYPNSVLWDKAKLIEMGLLKKGKTI